MLSSRPRRGSPAFHWRRARRARLELARGAVAPSLGPRHPFYSPPALLRASCVRSQVSSAGSSSRWAPSSPFALCPFCRSAATAYGRARGPFGVLSYAPVAECCASGSPLLRGVLDRARSIPSSVRRGPAMPRPVALHDGCRRPASRSGACLRPQCRRGDCTFDTELAARRCQKRGGRFSVSDRSFCDGSTLRRVAGCRRVRPTSATTHLPR